MDRRPIRAIWSLTFPVGREDVDKSAGLVCAFDIICFETKVGFQTFVYGAETVS